MDNKKPHAVKRGASVSVGLVYLVIAFANFSASKR